MYDWNTKPSKDPYKERNAIEYMNLYEKGNAPDIEEYHQSPQRIWFLGEEGCSIPRNMEFIFDSVFEGPVHIGSVNRIISFTKCYFFSKVTLNGNDQAVSERVVFQDCYFYEGVEILKLPVPQFNLIRPRINKTISIHECQIKNFSITGDTEELGEIDTLDLELAYANEGLAISNAIIKSINIKGLLGEKSELNVANIQFDNLKLSHLVNYGKLIISNPKELGANLSPDHFIITDSNLGKVSFFNLNLTLFKEVIFLRSLFIDSSWINVKWPEHLDRQGKLDDLVSIRDTYRQLKQVYAKQGDMVTENYFHKLEMLVYLDGLYKNSYPLQVPIEMPAITKWWKNVERNDITGSNLLKWTWDTLKYPFLWLYFIWTKFSRWTLRVQTLLVLLFSWGGGNFGISWVRPIVFLFIFNSILIAIGASCGMFDHLYFSWENIYYPGNILQTLPDVIYYSNPLRKFDEEVFRGWPILLDVCLRGISSYCIYNFIRATRRFVK